MTCSQLIDVDIQIQGSVFSTTLVQRLLDVETLIRVVNVGRALKRGGGCKIQSGKLFKKRKFSVLIGHTIVLPLMQQNFSVPAARAVLPGLSVLRQRDRTCFVYCCTLRKATSMSSSNTS